MPARPQLAEISLCCVDTRAPTLAWQSLQRSMQQADFAQVLLFTCAGHGLVLPPQVRCVEIEALRSGADYSRFVLRELPGYIDTSYVLLTQWDGFVVDGSAWTDEFLACDYIGAVWHDQPAGLNVGNGGFSLRSQHCLRAGLDERLEQLHPEDAMLCRRYRGLLEREHGLRFAPPALAQRFAFENLAPAGRCFGFHGPYNLPRFLDEAQLLQWLQALPEDFFRGRDARRLARALLGRGMAAAALQLLQRRQAAGRRDANTRLLSWLAALQHGAQRLQRRR